MLMATWHLSVRARLLPHLWLQARTHLNITLQTPSPSSLEIDTIPYPNQRPDTTVFEAMSDEYTSTSTSIPNRFTPLSSSETLASLVLRGNFLAAESLRKEMISHHIPIPRDGIYLRAALQVITERRTRGSAKVRLDAFEAWLSLAPNRHEEWLSFYDIRQRLFRSMDHLNLTLVYRFGLMLASKGYYLDSAATQAVSTLARYARPSVVAKYLHQVEDASQDYYARTDMVPPLNLLAGLYAFAIRTVALGNSEAAFSLISTARTRGFHIPDFTLDVVARHASNRQIALDRIQAVFPTWVPTPVASMDCESIPTDGSDNITILAARLRSLRTAFRSPCPPTPDALRSFIVSYQALGRTRAPTLLRSLAYHHSPKSASTWVFTEMLHYRSRQQAIHVLVVFSQHFHLVGVPRKTLLSFIRGTPGKQARKERVRRWIVPPLPMKEKLWPSAYHTALVWDAIVSLSGNTEKERLYALLISLVQHSLQQNQTPTYPISDETVVARVHLPPNTYDAAHFSPFVSAWARSSPPKAAGVLRDMVRLGVEPSLVQWSMVARGYAQHDDPRVALRILDRLEEREMGVGERQNTIQSLPSDMLLGIHTNVLRGFVLAGDVQHAREVEQRLVERLGYRGDRRATDATIALLRQLERRLVS